MRKRAVLTGTLLFGGAVAQVCFGQAMFTVTQLPSPNSNPNEITWISDDGNTMFGGIMDPATLYSPGGPISECYVTQNGNPTLFPSPGFSCNGSGGRPANAKGQFTGVLRAVQDFTFTAFANLDGTFDVFGSRLPDFDYTQYSYCAPNCAVPMSYNVSINDNGDIAGSASGFTKTQPAQLLSYGFVYSKGQVTRLPLLAAFAINNNGAVCGNMALDDNPNPITHAALYQNGKVIDLGSLGGNSYAWTINNKGQVGGDSFLRRFDPTDPFGSSIAQAFFWDGQVMNAITVPNAVYGSSVTSMNDNGELVGKYNPDRTHYAAFYYANGAAVDLNMLLQNPPPGLVLNWPISINNSGQILAAYLDDNGNLSPTYLLTPVKQTGVGTRRAPRGEAVAR